MINNTHTTNSQSHHNSTHREEKLRLNIINCIFFDIKSLTHNYTALFFIVLSILAIGIKALIVGLITTLIVASILYCLSPKEVEVDYKGIFARKEKGVN